MAILTQGTKVYAVDPEDGTVLAIACATAFTPGGNPADEIETTCLEEVDSKQYMAGLRTPGSASLTINADPTEASHVTLHGYSEANPQPTLMWAVGWSDGTEAPTFAEGAWVLPTTRTWFTFDGYVSDFPFDFAANTVVSTEVAIKRSGGSQWIPKTGA